MSTRWWRRRKRFHPWFGDFFDETGRIERIMDDIMKEASISPSERERARRNLGRQFEVFRPPLIGDSQMLEKYEPLLDVMENETCVVIVAELPGVEKDSIKINALEDKVTISVESPRRSFFKEVMLSARVDSGSSSASYKNGVLEIRFRKLASQKLLVE